jgi:hypothetical protein
MYEKRDNVFIPINCLLPGLPRQAGGYRGRMRGLATVAGLGAVLTGRVARACPTCRPAVEAGIFDEHFWGRLAITALPFALILCGVFLAHRVGGSASTKAPALKAPAPPEEAR